MSSTYIDDGFTLDGEVAELPGCHPRIQFKYRVAKPSYRYRYDRLQFGLPDSEVEIILGDVICDHLHELLAMTATGSWERIVVDRTTLKNLWPDIQVVIAEHIVMLRRPVLKKVSVVSLGGSGSSDSTLSSATAPAPTA